MESTNNTTVEESGFKFSLDGATFKIHKGETLLWHSGKDVVATGYGAVDFKELMVNGNIKNYPQMDKMTSKESSDFKIVHMQERQSVTLTGNVDLAGDQGTCVFALTFKVQDQQRISFQLMLNAKIDSTVEHNFIALKYGSDEDEEIFGMGIQYTVWNWKGRKMPLVVKENGVGRGLEPHTTKAGLEGGDDMSTYAPAATFVTNKERAFCFSTNYIGYANFNPDHTEMVYWHTNQIDGMLFHAQTELEQCQLISRSIGTMRKLPKWTSKGMITGIVGGQEKVEKTVKLLKDAGVKLAGIWMQDWVGQHRFPEGTRLKWSWKLSRQQYPEWDRMIDEWEKEGIKPITYCSSYIGDLSGIGAESSDYFKECDEKGYFCKNKEGKTYVLNSVSLRFAIPDFTNPAAREFCKNMIKENIIKEARSGGWMHDFGEYMPFDIVMSDGSDPLVYHNQYAYEWAKIGWEVLQETENGDELYYYMRAGTAMSPAYTTLFWMGDQLPTYDAFNGMQSAMIGILNGGLCGFTLGCSDIGGYTCQPETMRTQRLVERWIEMNAFSDMVMRSHPSNRPEAYQLWETPETLAHLAKFVNVHVALGEYKQMLQKEANEVGTPATRPMLLHFRHDPKARKDVSQFMLGENVLVAPVFDDDAVTRTVYLPGPATWTHVWSGKQYMVEADGEEMADFPAALGQVPAFYRNTEKCNLTDVFAQFVEN